MSEICLVSMPCDVLEQPSIGISLLVASARESGLSVRAIYPKFWFAEEVGMKTYTALMNVGKTIDLLGEWIFSSAAFPDFNTESSVFFREKLTKDTEILDNYYQMFGRKEDIYDTFSHARQKSLPFIEKTVERILELKPKIIGCSSNFQQHCASLALLRVIKEKKPEIITLLGGANCEGSMGKAIKKFFPFVDFTVSGEADILFPELCHMLLKEGKDVKPDKLPFGVISEKYCYRKQNLIEEDNYRATVCDLETLSIPDYEDYFKALDNFSYKERISPFLLMETSRGCWWAQKKPCTFCGLNGNSHNFRTKTPERVIREINFLSQKYSVNKFLITDNVLYRKNFQAIFPKLIQNGIPSYFFHWEARANLQEDDFKNLSAAGVRYIQVGIENLHQDSLKLLNKGVLVIQNVMTLKYAMENGIRIAWNFLTAFPGEQDAWYEELSEWLPLIFHLQPPTGIRPIRYDRFSTYYRKPQDFDIVLKPLSEYSHIFPLPEDKIKDMVYYFQDVNHFKREQSDGPGMARLKILIKRWKELFKNYFTEEKRVRLIVDEREDHSYILDTRPCAVENNIILEGVSHYLYRECSSPQFKDTVFKKLQKELFPYIRESEVDEAINYLSDKRLLLELDGKLLSLALREPVRPLITKTEFLRGNTGFTHVLDSILSGFSRK